MGVIASLLRWVKSILSYIHRLFCGPTALGDAQSSTQLLLHNDRQASLHTSHHLSAPPSLSYASSDTQLMLVMRHGHRQDEEQHDWHLSATRPWDPPLSKLGRRQARLAGTQLQNQGIQIVITSPFVRCLQTSAEIVAELGLKPGHWLVDWGLAEVCGQRQMCFQRPDAEPPLHSTLDTWMWKGQDIKGALEAFLQEEASNSGVGFAPEPSGGTLPVYPETLAQAVSRYHATLQAIMSQHPGTNVLVVSHGDVVGSAVTLQQPGAVVYEVNHTGYARLQRSRGVMGGWEEWTLACEPGQSGVSWFAED